MTRYEEPKDRNLRYINNPTAGRIYSKVVGGQGSYSIDRGFITGLHKDYQDVLTNAAGDNMACRNRMIAHTREQGFEQFIDLGCGLPMKDDLPGILTPGWSDTTRLVCVDNDPIVVAHMIHRGYDLELPRQHFAVIDEDVYDPDAVLDRAATVVDFSRPVVVLANAVFHFLPPARPTVPDPADVVARYASALCPGSMIGITHATTDGLDPTGKTAEAARALAAEYAKTTHPAQLRTRAEIAQMFTTGELEITEHGLDYASAWGNPDVGELGRAPATSCFLAGLGVVRE
ncbi:SAM-dependent methyltransferase [Amycolatopsis sp. CA-230715]|uniref:SAM-dependent methyltransferase n=1 Tax=Amycolatopsis sp. CA-230715 TaxID=2745196 RepID=UPI001C009362|nr:SAM-dependent methyltransferase [Amycolatopsis sp. CA-230715]QWF85891.1 hypothetical protein HUW46_09371 [Amycolatopsis sp. CA-230715]